MKFRSFIAALHAALLCILLAASPAGAGSMALMGVGPPPVVAGGGLVLDGITTGIKYAFSTRKLRTAYAGFAMRIQRSSDNATLDVGFVSGELDNSAVSAFVPGGANGKIITWYDQSGNGNDHVASAFASALLVFSNTGGGYTPASINGKTAVKNSTGAANESLQNTSLTANPVNTLYVDAVVTGNGGGGIVGPSVNGGFVFRYDGASSPLRVLKSNVASLFTSTSNTTLNGSIVEVQYEPVGGAWAMWIDRVAAGTGTQTATFTAATSSVSAVTEPWHGTVGEVIAYDLAGGIPGASQTTIRNNQATYWGTP